MLRGVAVSVRLTRPLLVAMQHALQAALAGAGFDDGDFGGENPEHYERALDWVVQEQQRREANIAKAEGETK